MIKLSSNITTWKSELFTYPVFTGSNGTSVYFKHGMNKLLDSYTIIIIISESDKYILHDFDRSSSNLYGSIQSGVGSNLNTVRIDIKRGPSSESDAYARLVFYGD